MSLQKRFDEKWQPVTETGCWLWFAACDQHGYGRINDGRTPAGNKRARIACRVSYELKHGHIPEGMVICHKCDTPACVNPDHLFLGTMKDNTADMIGKGRAKFGQYLSSRTHCKNGHPFSDGNLTSRIGGRGCKACGREKVARYRAKNSMKSNRNTTAQEGASK